MSVLTPYEEARAVLGLGATEEDAATIKRAYRRAVAVHAPDREPEAFRRARDAYELLTDPGARARQLLLRPVPMVPPPAPPEANALAHRGAAAVALLRALATQVDPDAWSTGAPRKAARGAQGARSAPPARPEAGGKDRRTAKEGR